MLVRDVAERPAAAASDLVKPLPAQLIARRGDCAERRRTRSGLVLAAGAAPTVRSGSFGDPPGGEVLNFSQAFGELAGDMALDRAADQRQL